MERLADPLLWLIVLLLVLLVGLPHSQALFSALFPALPCPVYQQESSAALALSHLGLVGISDLIAVLIGTGTGIAITRPWGAEFRPMMETIAAVGQTFPSVTVLAIAIPVMGFGPEPAIIALVLYSVLPILQATLAGLDGISPSAMGIANGTGMSQGQRLRKVELPLAAPVILAEIHTSVITNIDTATVTPAVRANTLGTPTIIGLDGFNTACVIQGAPSITLAAVIVDRGFDRLARHLARHIK